MKSFVPCGENFERIYTDIKNIIIEAREKVYKTVNFTMVPAYWEMGRRIVEEEQKGKERGEYGKHLIKKLPQKLRQDFGRGFNSTNLKYFRQFYLAFPIGHALRDQLTWTHYRML